MHKDGILTHHKILQNEELLSALKNKLLEESLEVSQATNRQELIAELADVFAVIEGICKTAEISNEEISIVQQQTAQTRGAFLQGIFITAIEMDESNHWVQHFRASPDKYPEE